MPSQSRRLERKKLLADPFTILVIILLVVLLTLFILYPLTMLMSDSVYSASSFNVYAVEQSADAVKELFSQASPRVREIGVGRHSVLQVPAIEGLTVLKEFGRSASFTYMGDLLQGDITGTIVAVPGGQPMLSPRSFSYIFNDYTFQRAFTNTLWLGFITGIAATLIGLLFAYVDVYVRVRSRVMKRLFSVVSMLPVVSPPFVLSLSMILLFGKGGLITR